MTDNGIRDTAAKLAAISQWVDDAEPNASRDPEARTWGRLAKVSEEQGEVIAAFIGVTGQNPRKGTTHTESDVIEELLDVALTALAAVEHMTCNRGTSLKRLTHKVDRVYQRSGRQRGVVPVVSGGVLHDAPQP